MDDAVKRFRERRVYRLSKRKEPRYDSVEAFRERRAQRLREREDADWKESDHKRDKGGRFASKDGGSGGAAKKPAANKLAAASTKSTAKTTSGGVVGSTYTRAYQTSGGVSYPTPKRGAVYDEDTLKEVNRLADSSGGTTQPKTKSQEAVLKKLTGKDLTYQTDPDGTVVASIPGLSQMYDSKVKGKSPAVQAAYDKRTEPESRLQKT